MYLVQFWLHIDLLCLLVCCYGDGKVAGKGFDSVDDSDVCFENETRSLIDMIKVALISLHLLHSFIHEIVFIKNRRGVLGLTNQMFLKGR